MKEPSHKILVKRYLDWNLVRERLGRYRNINKYYNLGSLQNCSNKSPFYTHYMSWRLGTWKSEIWFEFLDMLLAKSTRLPNWSRERIPKGCEFENFWSFLWELQIAELFTNYPNTKVEWLNSGPDIKVDTESGYFFVECTIYRKSFGLEEFISEMLSQIHPSIQTRHTPFNIFSLPKDQGVESFLDKLFEPLLDNSYVQAKLKEAKDISPLILPTPNDVENFYIFIEDDNAKEWSSFQPWSSTGSPENFLKDSIEKAINNKRESNKLRTHRQNLLAVNLLLGIDYQLATALRSPPTPTLGTEFDAVFLATCGIDQIPSLNNGLLHFLNNHPIKELLAQ